MNMRTLKHLVILSLVVFVAVFVAAPSALAKKALSEDEMDLITAAGQPKIIQTGTGSITFTDSPVNSLFLGTESQTNLTALVVNNVAGEVQLANAINVTSADFVNGTGPSQANTITQSWGATKDWTSASVEGVSATAVATASSGGTCTKCGIVRTGNATASASASTSPGVLKILTKYADQIVETVSGDIFVEQNGVNSLELEGTAQNFLSALVVNNVVGLSQVANAVNIMGGGLLFRDLVVVGSSTNNAPPSQSNTINQFRGTPFSRPTAP